MISKSTALGLLVLGLFAWLSWPNKEKPQTKAPVANAAVAAKSNRLDDKQAFIPQVVKAPENKVKHESFKVTNPQAIAFNENQKLASEGKMGTTPAITEAEVKNSPQIQAAIEATQNPEKFGNRLSPLIAPTLFNKERFLKDASYRQEYLSSAEPARAFKSDPDSDTKIERISPYYLEVTQGEEVEIQVKAAALLPVSIHSADLGQFKESGLTYATVLADAGGIATFTFKGVEGTFSDSHIVVSSPVTSGRLKFIVNTKIKNTKEN